jgi:small-conductance mechanosensitive channel
VLVCLVGKAVARWRTIAASTARNDSPAPLLAARTAFGFRHRFTANRQVLGVGTLNSAVGCISIDQIKALLIPSALIVSGATLGLISERLVLPHLSRRAASRGRAGEELLVSALRGITLVWGIAAGAYAALLALSLPPASVARLEHLLLLLIIPSITLVAARIAAGFVSPYSRNAYRQPGGAALPSPSIVTNLTRLVIFGIGGLVILQSFGIAITPILTALGVGGLAVALALQDTLSNLFSGLYIIAARQIKPGDYIRLNSGEEGYVVDITWRNTNLKEIPNNMIIVPNAKLAGANITNYDQPDKEVAVPVQLGVAYESDLDRVEQVALEVARQTMRDNSGAVADFEPVLRYYAFEELSINFRVLLRARTIADQYRLRHEFVKRVHERFRREGIAFHSVSEVYLKADGEAPERRTAWPAIHSAP